MAVHTKGGAPISPLGRDAARKSDAPERFGKAAFISSHRLALVQAALLDLNSVNRTSYTQQWLPYNKTRTPAAIDPWQVPNAYSNPAGHDAARQALQNDANHVYICALLYRLTGDASYAAGAMPQIQAWSAIQTFQTSDDSGLAWCVHIPAMIIGADMLKGSAAFTPAIKASFDAMVRKTIPLLSVAHTNENNWADWGVLFEITAGAYLADRAIFDKAAGRWKYLIETSLTNDGVLHHEVRREGGGQGNGSGGMWYMNYSLMPKTYAAEVMRTNGMDVYDYVSPSGRTLRAAWEKVAYWNAHPEAFTYNTSGAVIQPSPVLMGHVEILNNRWPNADANLLLSQLRPVDARHSVMYATLTHGALPLSG